MITRLVGKDPAPWLMDLETYVVGQSPVPETMVAPENHSPLSHTDQLLMMSLTRFYHDASNMRTVLPYMNNTSGVSLRMIDWFVTNYAKKCNVVIPQTSPSSHTVTEYFNVYLNYRSQLKAYSKQQFDPFRRRDRILLEYEEGLKHVQTTVGQLNFFRWLITNNVLEYVINNRQVIETDMMQSDRSAYQRSSRRNRPIVALSLSLDHNAEEEKSEEDVVCSSPQLDHLAEAHAVHSLIMTQTRTRTQAVVAVVESRLESRQDSGTGTLRRRTELSKATIPTMNRHSGMCTVMFT